MDSVVPIRDKYVLNTYLLNPIPEKDWIVRVGACCILPTNAHDHRQMIDSPGTCWGVCNTPLPIRIKNLIPLWTMNLKLGTCRGVCNTPLPIWVKNLIPIYRMNLKPGTCRVICNTPLHMPYKYLINMYLLNHIPGENWIVHIGAYCIRYTNAHDHRQMIDPPGTFWSVCNTPLQIPDKFLINTYLLNLISGKDWMVRVGAYCIRPTDTHVHGKMIDPPYTFRGVCNTTLPIPDKSLINTYLLNPIPGKDWNIRVGAYCIRPANSNDHRKMIDPPDTFWGVCNTLLPIRDKYLINKYLLNSIPDKD